MARSRVRIVVRKQAIGELLRSREAQAEIRRRAERVAAAAGPGVEVLPMQTPRVRARAVVAPVTAEAAKRVAEENSLIRALDAGRG